MNPLTQADPWKCIKNIRMKNGTHFCVFSSMKRCNAKSCLYKNWKITCINFFSTSDCHQLLLFRSNRTRLQKNKIFAFIYNFHLLFWHFLQYLQTFELFKCTFSISEFNFKFWKIAIGQIFESFFYLKRKFLQYEICVYYTPTILQTSLKQIIDYDRSRDFQFRHKCFMRNLKKSKV